MVFLSNDVIDLSSSPSPPSESPPPGVPESSDAQRSYLATLDRAAMEAERLKRVARAQGGGRPKREREEDDSDDIAIEDQGERTWVQSNEVKRPREDTSQRLPFPHGVVKKTAVSGYPRVGDDITIEEVLQPNALRSAVLSSFSLDEAWILDKLHLDRTSLVLVVHAKSYEERAQWRIKTSQNRRICMPPMDGLRTCMHSKLQLLFYDNYLRVCIPSANLTDYDWGEGAGVLENIMYIHDFPLLPEPSEHDLPEFASELVYFLEKQNMYLDILDRLRTDVLWQNTENVRFVHSVAGAIQDDESMMSTGYLGLSRAVRDLVGHVESEAQVDYVTSSLGSLKNLFVQNIYQAASGKEMSISRLPQYSAATFALVQSRMRVYYPSRDTVVTSKGGFESGGTLFFNGNAWNRPGFPQEIIRDGRSVRRGCLMHDKVMFVRFDDPVTTSDGKSVAGIAYVGSANMSESAWGKLVWDRSTKRMKFNVRNWECGVAIRADAAPASSTIVDLEKTFKGMVPVPMETAATEYGNKYPWSMTWAD